MGEQLRQSEAIQLSWRRAMAPLFVVLVLAEVSAAATYI